MEETLEDPILDSPRSRPVSNRARMGLVALVGAVVLVSLALLSNAMDRRKPEALDTNRAELVAVTTGTVREVCVKEGQIVQPGDSIINFDDTTEQTILAEAQAKLQEVSAEAQGSDVAIAIPGPLSLGGRIIQTGPMTSEGPIPVLPRATASGKLAPLPPVSDSVDHGVPVPPGPSPKAKAEAEVKDLETDIQSAKDLVLTDQQAIESTQAELDDAQRNADAAKAIAGNKRRDADKMQMLLREGAVAQVEATRSEAMASSAQGAAEAAQRQADELKAKVEGLQSEIGDHKIKVALKEKELVAAKDRAAKAPDSVAPVHTDIMTPGLTDPVTTMHRPKPAFVREAAPPTSNEPAKVSVDLNAKRATDSKMQAAKAAVDNAEKDVLARRVRANRKGKIVQILVKPGSTVQPGQTLVIIQYDSKQ